MAAKPRGQWAKGTPRWYRLEAGNLEAATVIIEDPALTPGPDSLMYQWAILFMSRRNAREQLEALAKRKLSAMGLTRERAKRPLSDHLDSVQSSLFGQSTNRTKTGLR